MILHEMLVFLLLSAQLAATQDICVCQIPNIPSSWGQFATNWSECLDSQFDGRCTRTRQRLCRFDLTNCDVVQECDCGAQWGPWSNTNQCTSICGNPGLQQQSRTCYINTNRRTTDCEGADGNSDQLRTQSCTRTQSGCDNPAPVGSTTTTTTETLPSSASSQTTRTRIEDATSSTSTRSQTSRSRPRPPPRPPILAGNDLIILASILGSVTVICIAIVVIVVVVKKKKQQQGPVLQNNAANNIMFDENRSRGNTAAGSYPPALPVRQTTIMSDTSGGSTGKPKTINNTLYHEITPSVSLGSHHNQQLPVPGLNYQHADVSAYSSAEPTANLHFGRPTSDGYLSPLPIDTEESVYFSIDEMGTMK